MAPAFKIVLNGAHAGDDLRAWPRWPAVYSIFTASCFLLFAAIRAWQLRRTSVKVKPASSSLVKLVTTFAFLALQLSNLVRNSSGVFNIRVLSNAISSVAALGFCILSFVEHRRSPTPSTLLVLYALACLLGSGVELLILPPMVSKESLSFPIAKVCLELAVLVVECQKKYSILLPHYQQLTPEERAGVLERTFFWWINPILMKGHRLILTDADLPRTGEELSSKRLRRKILRTWDQRAKPERATTLPYVLLVCFKRPVAAAILPRLFLIAFRYSQPLLINIAIRYISSAPKESASIEDGRWLIVGALVVYVGLAISKATYQHQLNRLQVMIRGALVGLIYQRSLHVRNASYEDGNAVTLMSTDVDNVQGVGEMFHETWAYFLEVVIGTSLLATQIGWVWPIPLIIIVFCSRVSRYVATHLNRKQRDWSVATQKRISMTISMLASAKSIKMLGISEAIQMKVQGLRLHEIAMSKRLRWMMVGYNASANALGIFSPIITLVVFAIISRNRGDEKLDAGTAFTTIALMTFISHPANMLMTIYPRAVACMANFERIQRYLLESSRQDDRLDLRNTVLEAPNLGSEADLYALVADNISVQYSSSLEPILQDINFKVKAGSFWIFSGRVGSGKTTLSQVILGEVPSLSGSMAVSTRRIGFCPQTPWLPSSSIKEIICEDGDSDPEWYKTVISACGLKQDLDAFPHGDQTQIGSRGLKLSGGQRQRVALARAVYARCDILVLDDPFSALDGATEHHVVQTLLGPEGLLRQNGPTVILITNNVQHYSLADQIIILGDSHIQLQGAPDDVLHSSRQILKTILDEKEMKTSRHLDELEVKQLAQTKSTDAAALNLKRRTGDMAVYGYYFRSVGVLNYIILVCCTASCSFFLLFSQYWVKWWTESESDQTWFYVGGYLMFAFIAWSSTNGTMWAMLIKIAPHSGIVLHYNLLKSIIGAPLSFYSKSEIGTLLNRFSQDIQLVDKKLPPALSSLTTQIFKLSMQAAILFSAQKRILVTLPFCVLIVYFVQKIYLRTSRQLRFLELESRSAVYSSFLETVDGITSIRAFNWQKKFESKNIAELEISQSPFYLLLCLQRWLNIVLDLLVAGIAVGVISISVAFRGTMTGGQIGVALNMILLVNTTLLALVTSYTNLEISLGAIARLKDTIQNTPQEDGPEGDYTIQGWPSAGDVKVDNLEVSYIPSKLALCDINLKVESGQRLILCGRTGSGKSTFVLSLLRLLDPSAGSITVDGTNISELSRSSVRQKCFISVPQDPFLLPDATLRFNVDPIEHYQDEEIVTALEKTRLWKQFSQTRANGQTSSSTEDQITTPGTPDISQILDSPLSSLPQLSTGQQQLLSLARAVLRAQPPTLTVPYTDHILASVKVKPILLLDEATSSLDEETEAMIYEIIKQEFTDKGHTAIAISHRLGALKKGWKKGRDVLVRMADGRVEEMGDLTDVLGDGVGDDEVVNKEASGTEGMVGNEESESGGG